MVHRFRSVAFMLLTLAPLSALSTTPPLQVTVEAPASSQDAESGIVVVAVTNQSDRPLLILMAGSALLSDGEHLLNDVMTVTTPDGRPVAYKGRSARPAISHRGAYWTVAPGEVKRASVDLPANYAVEGGTYLVSYTQRYLEVSEFDPDGAPEHEVHSNTLSIYTNSNLIQGKKAESRMSPR